MLVNQMKMIGKKLLLLLLFIPLVSFGQENVFLNGYKYIYVPAKQYYLSNGTIKSDFYDLSDFTNKYFLTVGYTVLNNAEYNELKSSKKKCEVLTADIEHFKLTFHKHSLTFKLYNCNSKLIYSETANRGNSKLTTKKSLGFALSKTLKNLKKNKYFFDTNKSPVKNNNIKEIIVEDDDGVGDFFNIKSENSIRKYFDKNGYEGIEGIWNVNRASDEGVIYSYKIMIIRDGINYNGIVIEGGDGWFPGDVKAVFEETAVNDILTVNWTMADKSRKQKIFANIISENMIQFALSGDVRLYKVYPKIGNNKNNKNSTTIDKFKGNGSGIIISKSGYIITNYHVIDNTTDIEVEFILNDKIQTFNAEIVEFDKENDLAILKILDMNFDGVDELPYNFKTRSSDVGTKVYAFGYPMALSIMGKEIKVTDGMISSKTGFDGNIRTYQITAPIQGGNSGGPLFDEKGNLIGINSSGIRKDIADNVAYSIKTSYVLNLIDILPKSIELPSNTKLESLPLTEQIKEISKYVVLIKVK
jgi:S1-C subfamily serine protease